jgi:hypothetical protein
MFRSVLTATLLAALASFSLPAQTVKLQANIPFEFHVGAAIMPAGEYLVTHTSGILLLRGQYNRPKSAGVIVGGTTKGIETAGDKLVFNRYGNEYFLSTVWQASAGSGLMVPKTKREKEVASSFARAPEAAMVALRTK